MSLGKQELHNLIAAKRSVFKLKTDDSIVNSDGFRKLVSLLITFSNSKSAFAFHLTEADLKSLDFPAIESNLNSKITNDLKLNNFFVVDNSFNVIEKANYNPANSEDARIAYKEFSQNEHCVILIINQTYATYYNGVEITNTTFTAEADLKKWGAKRDISSLFEVIDEYKTYIKSQTTYIKFFTEKVNLVRIYGDKTYLPYKNLLRNKPESILRDDLRNFLRDNINRTFNFHRESMLDSSKRLDINTEDELGNYYFLEIKWVGKSINDTGTAVGKTYPATRPQEGLKQTLEYIDELKTSNKTVKLGCLIVFDARDNKVGFTYDITKINPTLHAHMACYHCIDDLHIDNIHPI